MRKPKSRKTTNPKRFPTTKTCRETIESDDDSQPVDTIESDDETQPDETIESDDDDETLLEPVDSDDEEDDRNGHNSRFPAD